MRELRDETSELHSPYLLVLTELTLRVRQKKKKFRIVLFVE